MSAISHEQWKVLSPHLDAVLDMTEEERASWISSLRKQDAALAGALERLLQEHRELSDKRFMEEQVRPLPPRGTLAGQKVGVYTLLSEIGHGGMGSVWLAQRSDGRFRRRVAIKLLNIGCLGHNAEQRLKREGSILARLTHPNVAELLDAGVTAWGQPYLILEYVEAEHIDRYCDKKSLDVAARLRILLDVLAAVSHAHRNLIVHCDIKPSNVLVKDDGGVKLLDFGIAKLLASEPGAPQTTQLTVDDVRPMTPRFAAPEQLRGEAVTTSTDVYALGVLLYQLLTGHHPAGDGARSSAELITAVIDREPVRPSDVVFTSGDPTAAVRNVTQRATNAEKLRRILRGDLDTITLKALKKDPCERYPSVAAFEDDLRRYLRNQPISARNDAVVYRALKFVRRHRAPVLLGAMVMVTALAGTVTTLLQARSARMQREFALTQLARVERINSLNELLLTDVAPLGRPLSATELLDREWEVVERERYDDVASHVDLLVSIGGQYSGMEENEKAHSVLEEAYKLSRGIEDRSARGRVACELGWALLPSGELNRAESLVSEGLNDLPDQPQFASDRVQCLLRGSDVAYRAGNARLFFDRARTADRVLQQLPVRSPVQELEVLTGLADAYQSSGQFREADAAFERAAARMRDLGYGETQRAVKLFNDWGFACSNAGRPLDAEKRYRRSIEISRANKGEDMVQPTLLHNYSVVLRELGKLNEAADYEERAHQKAVRMGDQMLALQTNLQLVRIYRDQHRFQQASALLAEIEPVMRQKLPPAHYAFASLTSDKALLAEQQGDLAAAFRLANEAVAIDEAAIRAGGEGSIYLPILLTRRSVVELASGSPDQASADAQRAVSLLKDSMQAGTQSSHMGRAFLALGRALQAQGRREEACSAFRSASEQLGTTVGGDHPDSRAARQLAGLSI
jgi:serine/threonine-protein kinase